MMSEGKFIVVDSLCINSVTPLWLNVVLNLCMNMKLETTNTHNLYDLRLAPEILRNIHSLLIWFSSFLQGCACQRGERRHEVRHAKKETEKDRGMMDVSRSPILHSASWIWPKSWTCFWVTSVFCFLLQSRIIKTGQLRAVSLQSHCQGEVTSVKMGGIFPCSVL